MRGGGEISWRKGHSYLTMVYQLDAARKRLQWGDEEREKETLAKCLRHLGPKPSARVKFV